MIGALQNVAYPKIAAKIGHVLIRGKLKQPDAKKRVDRKLMVNLPQPFKHTSGDLRVFVYGTLMPGELGYQQFCAGRVTQTWAAIAPGKLYDLPAGYPAMTSGQGWVQGYVLAFANPQILVQLDDYEDYDPGRGEADNLYYRQQLEVFSRDRTSLGLAWVYLMRSQFVQALRGKYLPNGRWR